MGDFTAVTVEQTMRTAGLVKDGSREALKNEFIAEETVDIGGKTYTLSKISYWDSKMFSNELDAMLQRQNPRIHDIYGRGAVNCFDLVRMVNTETKQGFAGALGSGNQLDATQLMARSLYDPDNSGSVRTTFVRTISSVGSKNFFEGSGSGNELTMAEEEGMIWLGWYNPAQTPVVDSFQIIMNTEALNIQSLDFDQVDLEDGDPIIEFKQPWTLPPEQSGEILAYYGATGTDEMRPIGLWIKMARNLRNLATVRT